MHKNMTGFWECNLIRSNLHENNLTDFDSVITQVANNYAMQIF